MNGVRGGVVVLRDNNNIVIEEPDVKLLRAVAYKFICELHIVAEEKLLQLLRTTPPNVDTNQSSNLKLIKTFVTVMGKIDMSLMFCRVTNARGNLSMREITFRVIHAIIARTKS